MLRRIENIINRASFHHTPQIHHHHVIRHFRPARIVEIGSGHSTRMARLAIGTIQCENPDYRCEHMCIEPYEMPWLEQLGVTVVRKKVEDVDDSVFTALRPNDILFIDSSHIIRPEGDVLREFLEILPSLAPGVIVHVHDIFTPRERPDISNTYFGAMFHDLDGHRIEVLTHNA